MDRIFITAGLLFLSFIVRAQAFQVVDTNVMIRNNQSPVHWYGEVDNLVGVDTTLHWKVVFRDVPKEWVINFDDQYQFYDTLQHGDSADFVLYGGQALPQKLIIGISLNGVYGKNAVITFRLSDPADSTVRDVVHFNIEVPPYTVGMEELGERSPFTLLEGQLLFHEKVERVRCYDLNGTMLVDKQNVLPGAILSIPVFLKGLGIVQTVSGRGVYTLKLVQLN